MKLSHFLRIFWPKEMRNLVDQYEREGVLNEMAVRSFNNKQWIAVIMLMICLLIDKTPYHLLSGCVPKKFTHCN
jgi:uncharacterized membrane protein